MKNDNVLPLLISSFIFIYYIQLTSCKEGVQMRMVEEPVNMGQWNNDVAATDVLTPKVKPSNFSGPPHLRTLLGKCLQVVENSYKYEVCPFQNITQHEQSNRWNPYSGILGNWYEWEIENNTFVAMLYKNGDDCGLKSRQVSVKLQCGTKTAIVSVSEPDTCCYAMNISTPLVCHPDSLLVYPTLSKPLQQKWNALEGRLYREEVTRQGYNKMLHKIFEEAGLVMDPTFVPKNDRHPLAGETKFENVDTCQESYNNLLQEVERLRGIITAEDVNNGAHDEANDYEPSVDFNNYGREYDRKRPKIDDPFLY
ncbi:N-acetylglucosamine-1-phosphotransferase subunit gamma-like isoform X1 [Apostichopus japonicus]|uniref:N-acetylglucosamine-1-phosphotransferase subunit gamma-like isoform X1 n=1 Tax=Stichopus japonicus TaxID=307972 RepID=UPI003AB841FB